MTEKIGYERMKTELLERGYSIQLTLSLGGCKCSICHSSWVTDNLYATVPLPTGKGETEALALQDALNDWAGLTQEDNHDINNVAKTGP